MGVARRGGGAGVAAPPELARALLLGSPALPLGEVVSCQSSLFLQESKDRLCHIQRKTKQQGLISHAEIEPEQNSHT